MAKKATNWSLIRDKRYLETAQGRDVYNRQQLERGELRKKQTMFSRMIFCIIMALLAAFLVYASWCAIASVTEGLRSSLGSQGYHSSMMSGGSTGSGDGSGSGTADGGASGGTSGEDGTSGGASGSVHLGGKYEYKSSLFRDYKDDGDMYSYDYDYDYSHDAEGLGGQDYEASDSADISGSGDYDGSGYGSAGSGGPGSVQAQIQESGGSWWRPRSFNHIMFSLLAGLLTFSFLYIYMKKNLAAQNSLSEMTDINQYDNDQHIALPEEIQRKYDWFPDIGAHSDVQVSSLISHMMLSNKGIRKIQVPERYKEDVVDEDGAVVYHKGEIVLDENEEPVMKTAPMFDEDFGVELFRASFKRREDADAVYMTYDAKDIPYNPDNMDRDKLKGYDTVSELINKNWVLPDYEPQRPAGAYIVDTAPVNTMILAITRAGKGQTIIEPTLDMWLRELRPNNIVVNDPKGELLVKFYVAATIRGFRVVQFNLINAMKTDIYNPLMLAANAAREGDFTKCAMYVENIADVFFPVDGAEDPVWPNAANNAFKRAAYGLIDYFMEEERTYRNDCAAKTAAGKHVDRKTMETHIDSMWGKVTLYNCYQFFVQLTSKKLTNPAVEFSKKYKAGEFEELTDDEINAKAEEANRKAALWNGSPETDSLALYFNATEKLPENNMRRLIANANNALKSMAGAEKMMASVYGIAITAMSFFTDPTISTLTSGTPSQNVDLAGLSFPRRAGVRFHPDFIKKNHYVGLQAKWSAYADKDFTENLGKDFMHSDIISREGWARYFFDGKFKKDVSYVRLQLCNATTQVLVHEYYFEFRKNYLTSLDGKTYVKDPVLDEKIVTDGILTEMIKDTKTGKFKYGVTRFKRTMLKPNERYMNEPVSYRMSAEKIPAITQNYVKYQEKPKMVFLVTPPHLMKYAKLILILIKQLVDLNFDQSYMTKENQKPLYKTRYMLDELGNLQSEGHGISGFETMLSIGLGQDQQFTLILQTLQQLKDVYGDSVDKIVQGNTSNIVFLKSTDDSMIETLQKMSGTTHKSFVDQKTVTYDAEKIFMPIEGKGSYMASTKEVPVISYNDMNSIAERNSIVFRAGDSPIWNKNETILPMSWKLHSHQISIPGKKFSLQTIPTLSTAIDFDLTNNIPNFKQMLFNRMDRALRVEECLENYKEIFDYSDDDLIKMNQDVFADDIMSMVDDSIRAEKEAAEEEAEMADMDDDGFFDDPYAEEFDALMSENTEVAAETESRMQQAAARDAKIYAGSYISKSDLVEGGIVKKTFNADILEVYRIMHGKFEKDPAFVVIGEDLCDRETREVYIRVKRSSDKADMDMLVEESEKEGSGVYSEGNITEEDKFDFTREVTDEFIRYLAGLPDWNGIANGEFENRMALQVKKRDIVSAAQF